MSNVLQALDALDVSTLTYQEWVNVGMALHAEGFDWSVWDNWSRADRRYRPGECERKWRTFRGCSAPLKGGTIVQMAKQRGWMPRFTDGVMDWNDSISEDGDGFTPYAAPDRWNPAEQLITYLETLFDRDDFVGYVTGDVWKDSDGRWMPSKGVFDRTAGELIASLQKHGNDIGATFGDWKPEVGAWIRFNAVDGEGVKNDNITKFRYALVESDSMPIADQDAMYRKLELPIACLVHSGGKSLHAIVRVDADTYDEYRKRVEFLYDFLQKNGVQVDTQNRNPSRLSRMPGVTRNGNRQYLVGTNIGRKNWVEWMDFVEGASDELPDMRGQIYNIDGSTFFTMGGARSHDIQDGILEPDEPGFEEKFWRMRRMRMLFRVNHYSWWKEEMPSEEEYEEARNNLRKADYKVDYIITHCAPDDVLDIIGGGMYEKDPLSNFLEEVRTTVDFKHWYFGHFHDDRHIGQKFTLLYDEIIPLE